MTKTHFTVWADNADYLSKQYTGTSALKTDYTRNGKQSISGNVHDKVNALKRIVKHQVFAEAHEEEMDIFLGHIIVDPCIKAYSTSSRDFQIPPGKVFANDNMFFTGVTKIGHFDRSLSVPVILRVCTSASLLSIIEPERHIRRDYSLDGIYDIERSTVNYRQLNVYIGSHLFPVSLVFPTKKKGLAFYSLIEPILFKKYPLMAGLLTKQIPLNFYIFTWNAAGAIKDPTKVVAGISQRRDLYIICARVKKLLLILLYRAQYFVFLTYF